jgi:hypothetical protein
VVVVVDGSVVLGVGSDWDTTWLTSLLVEAAKVADPL